MGTITIKKLHIRANHGVFSAEKELGQNFYIDIDAQVNYYAASIDEDLSKSVHYGELADYIYQEFTKKSYDLIETAAIKLADSILNQYQLINKIKVTIHKPEAPVAHSYEDIAVSITRMRNIAYVSLGSNMGDSNAYFDKALQLLAQNPSLNITQSTTRMITKAYGKEDQADFLNAIIQIETYLEPEDLLNFLNKIEAQCDRVRSETWGPRTLDLDILLYNAKMINQDNLIIPHYDLHKRDFVLKQLCELNPYLIHPRFNLTMEELLQKMGG